MKLMHAAGRPFVTRSDLYSMHGNKTVLSVARLIEFELSSSELITIAFVMSEGNLVSEMSTRN